MTSVRCVACDLHTTVPRPLERTCWRQFVVQWGDCKKSWIALVNAIIIIITIINCNAQIVKQYHHNFNNYSNNNNNDINDECKITVTTNITDLPTPKKLLSVLQTACICIFFCGCTTNQSKQKSVKDCFSLVYKTFLTDRDWPYTSAPQTA